MKDIRFTISTYEGKQLYESGLCNSNAKKTEIMIYPNLRLNKEFKFELKKKFHLWQHCYFVKEKEVYHKTQIDGAFNNNSYSDDFNIEFLYSIENDGNS